jgi:hypothetical protein
MDFPAFFCSPLANSVYQDFKGITMKHVQSIWQVAVALLTWFHKTTIAPDNQGVPLPPIRHHGDPTDIYLA